MKKCFVFLLAMTLIASALGQGSSTQLNIKEEGSFLLSFPTVQKELAATPQQTTAWEAMFEKQADDERAIYAKAKPDASPEDIAADEKTVEALEKTVATKALSLATEAQVKRLVEITLQRLDLEAFAKVDVQTELGFTSAQKRKANDLIKQYLKKQEDNSAEVVRALDKIPQPKEGDEAGIQKYGQQMRQLYVDSKAKDKELDALRASLKSEVLATFTDAQRDKWKAMIGAPFNIDSIAPLTR